MASIYEKQSNTLTTRVSRALTWLGIALIIITGLIHLIEAPESFDDATYKGVLFVLNGLGARRCSDRHSSGNSVVGVGTWLARRWWCIYRVCAQSHRWIASTTG